ncbi:MAG TPA: NAD(P)H-dependent oxidoreductase subunit E [Bacteroidales bacterium]|jgi:NADH:ubiquinone oxidoreductase subunit E|nr:hypothetical protein [Bacteroidales bacterium]HNV96115.1 NAD(P)H-dependent oxidoreductase subunit E [Bacteroidales bacterium]
MNTIKQILSTFPGYNKGLVIPALQAIQAEYGSINLTVLYEVAEHFNTSSEQIYSILSFYPQFRFKPKGKYHIEICNSPLCKMNHHQEIISYLKNLIGIEPGEISSDALYSLDIGMCTGICKKHIRINNDVYLISSVDEIKSILDKYSKETKL